MGFTRKARVHVYAIVRKYFNKTYLLTSSHLGLTSQTMGITLKIITWKLVQIAP